MPVTACRDKWLAGREEGAAAAKNGSLPTAEEGPAWLKKSSGVVDFGLLMLLKKSSCGAAAATFERELEA